MGNFSATLPMRKSWPTFYGGVFQFGNKMRITSPSGIIKEYRRMRKQ